jgi:hypothetical protein
MSYPRYAARHRRHHLPRCQRIPVPLLRVCNRWESFRRCVSGCADPISPSPRDRVQRKPMSEIMDRTAYQRPGSFSEVRAYAPSQREPRCTAAKFQLLDPPVCQRGAVRPQPLESRARPTPSLTLLTRALFTRQPPEPAPLVRVYNIRRTSQRTARAFRSTRSGSLSPGSPLQARRGIFYFTPSWKKLLDEFLVL